MNWRTQNLTTAKNQDVFLTRFIHHLHHGDPKRNEDPARVSYE